MSLALIKFSSIFNSFPKNIFKSPMESRLKYNPAVFSKSIGHNAYITNPNQIISSDVQVHHLVNQHHPNQVYSNMYIPL